MGAGEPSVCGVSASDPQLCPPPPHSTAKPGTCPDSVWNTAENLLTGPGNAEEVAEREAAQRLDTAALRPPSPEQGHRVGLTDGRRSQRRHHQCPSQETALSPSSCPNCWASHHQTRKDSAGTRVSGLGGGGPGRGGESGDRLASTLHIPRGKSNKYLSVSAMSRPLFQPSTCRRTRTHHE